MDEAEYTPVFAAEETEAEIENIKEDIEEDEGNKDQKEDIVNNQEDKIIDETLSEDTEIKIDENKENEEKDKENPDSNI